MAMTGLGGGWQTSGSGGGGGTIGGGGTLNYVAKFTPDGTHIGDTGAPIFDDGTNVGIGTITPTARVHVKGAGNTSATYAIKTESSTVTGIFDVRNDGYISAGNSNKSITIGLNAGYISTLTHNTIYGINAINAITTGTSLVAIGSDALSSVTTGSSAVAVGDGAMKAQTTGIGGTLESVAVGSFALAMNTTGFYNVAIGDNALGAANVVGTRNVAVGWRTLYNSTGGFNTAVGWQSQITTTGGEENASLGYSSLQLNTTGGTNTAIGSLAGNHNTSGSANVFLGYSAGFNQTTASNQLFIDNRDRGVGNDLTNSLIYGVFNATVSSQTLRVNASLGVNTAPSASIHVVGFGNTSATSSLRMDSSTVNSIFVVRNDGYISAGLTNGSMTIGFGSGFYPSNIYNTILGVNAGVSMTTGNTNTILGGLAGHDLTSGSNNVFLGAYAGNKSTTAGSSVAIGLQALLVNTTGQNNVAIGQSSLQSQNGVNGSVAVGYESAIANTSGAGIVAVGNQALHSQTSGDNNTAIGYNAMSGNISGYECTAVGTGALGGAMVNPTHGNTAVGSFSMASTTGGYNTAIGEDSMFANTSGVENCAGGRLTLGAQTTASRNTGFGTYAGFTNVTGTDNVFLGYSAGYFETGSSKLFIDNATRASEADGRVKALMYGIFDAATANQFVRFNANIGVLTNTFGTSADGVIGINNGTAPTTSPVNMIQLFSVDTDDNTASLGLRTEQAVVNEVVVQANTLKVTINGTIYKLLLS